MNNNSSRFKTWFLLPAIIFALSGFLFVGYSIINISVVWSQQQETEKNTTQIIIGNTGMIDKFKSVGDYEGENYTKIYTPVNVVDNLINDYSFWGQFGKSSFTIELKEKLENPVCSVEINTYNPKNTPFELQFNDKIFQGVLDKQVIPMTFENCVEGVDSMSMRFDADGKWTVLSEVKLFSNEEVDIPPVECDKGYHMENGVCVPDVIDPPPTPEPVDSNATNINIIDSNATLNIINSTIKLQLESVKIELENQTEVHDNSTNNTNNQTLPISNIEVVS